MPISLLHLNKTYDGKPVLTDFNLILKDRGITCLMGPSGCGKTTAAHILLGIVPPDSGEITGLDGHILSAVFQESRLLDWLDAIENIRLVTQKAVSVTEISDMLDRLGLSDSMRKSAVKLSGGMRRRVAIARALLYPSDFMVMDEPFKGLDDERKLQVMDIVAGYAAHRGILFITHDPIEAQYLGAEVVRMGEGI